MQVVSQAPDCFHPIEVSVALHQLMRRTREAHERDDAAQVRNPS